MKLKTILATSALALSIGAASTSSVKAGLVPEPTIELIEQIDYDDPYPTPLVLWPHGLYNNESACAKARTYFIGPQYHLPNPIGAHATWKCEGKGHISIEYTTALPEYGSPTEVNGLTALNPDGTEAN